MTTTIKTDATTTHATAWRNGYKWTINECLRLEREFDLLQLTVPEMATLHSRTDYAIICKLHAEGLADFNELYLQTYGLDHEHQVNMMQSLSQTNPDADDDLDSDSEAESSYVPDLVDDSESESDSDADEDVNEYYLAQQVKLMQKQINTLMGYFTNKKSQQALAATL
jgi:hypothetical protein